MGMGMGMGKEWIGVVRWKSRAVLDGYDQGGILWYPRGGRDDLKLE